MEPLVWIDMEMSGLDPATERVLEIAVLVTDAELQTIAEGPEIVVFQDEATLGAMDEWNTTHHSASGLVERVRASTTTEADAEAQLLAFLEQHTQPRQAPLAGNSVHQDRRFLRRWLPRVDAHLHYRIVDVSTVKELARRWYPRQFAQVPPKREAHRALEDIRESIAELRWYREHVFRAPLA